MLMKMLVKILPIFGRPQTQSCARPGLGPSKSLAICGMAKPSTAPQESVNAGAKTTILCNHILKFKHVSACQDGVAS